MQAIPNELTNINKSLSWKSKIIIDYFYRKGNNDNFELIFKTHPSIAVIQNQNWPFKQIWKHN